MPRQLTRHSIACVFAPLRGALFLCALCALAACLMALPGCSGGGSGGDSTSGPSFSPPATIVEASYNESAATTQNGASIDISSVAQGYVAVSAVNSSRLKLQVVSGQASYNYDLANDGTPQVFPLNMGDGSYTFRVMQNTSGSSYVEIASVGADVVMSTEYEPYLRPNVFCNFSDSSECVALARELTADAQNEGDAVAAIYNWIVENISYDTNKAAELSNATGYVPDPDATLSSRTGICFDYASLGAAMLRSMGIPTKIVTGYVSPNGIYHAWNSIYLDGSWTNAHIRVDANTWTLIDLTFAAASDSGTVGDGTDYTDRYTY